MNRGTLARIAVRGWIRPLLPLPVARWLRWVLGRHDITRSWVSHSWEGVYRTYRDIQPPPGTADGFARRHNTQPAIDELRNALELLRHRRPIETNPHDQYLALPFLVGLTAARHGGKVTVLDFGGGVGIEYAHVVSNLPDEIEIAYHIVEQDWACRAGRSLWTRDRRILFHESFPDVSGVSIVNANSSLQYVEDYQGALSALCRYRAEYVLIAKTIFTEAPSFATVQMNTPGAFVPCWIFNIGEITDMLRRGGYSPLIRVPVESRESLDNIPIKCRPWVLVFHRESSTRPLGMT